MKVVVVQIDGAADEAVADLGGKTPLEQARLPHLDRLARRGILGLTRTIPRGTPARTDVGATAVLGYEPAVAPGPAVLDAIGCGIELAEDDVVYRVSLVRLAAGENGKEMLRGPIGGGLSDVEAHAVFAELRRGIGRPGLEFVAGRGHHLLVCRQGDARVQTVSPYDLLEKPVAAAVPQGPGAALAVELIARSREILAIHPICAAYGENSATALWPWGQGVRRAVPRFRRPGAMIPTTDLARGVARLVGFDIVEAAATAGVVSAQLRASADAALQALVTYDFCLLDVPMADALGHAGDGAGKVGFLEQLDEQLIGPLLEGLRATGTDWRLMILPGFGTPCARRVHSEEPVPFLVYTGADEGKVGARERGFNERDAREHGIFIPEARALMDRLLREG